MSLSDFVGDSQYVCIIRYIKDSEIG